MGTNLLVKSAINAFILNRYGNRKKIDEVQKQKLSNLLLHTIQNIPFYKNNYLSSSLDYKNLLSFPAMTKTVMMDNLPDFVSCNDVNINVLEEYLKNDSQLGQGFLDKYMISVTSGTTGRKGYFLWDLDAFANFKAMSIARVLRHKLTLYNLLRFSYGRKYKMAFIIATDGPYITYQTTLSMPFATRFFANMNCFSLLNPVSTVAFNLQHYCPHYLHGYPTYLEALAHEKIKAGLNFLPEVISTGSEPLTETAKSILKKAFEGTYISETYGTTECLAIANQCKYEKLHVNEDYVILEAVDNNNNPVKKGTISDKILITNLENRVQPIIRYEITDSVVFTGETCECGSHFPVIQVFGRTDDTFYLIDSSGSYSAHPPLPFEVVLVKIIGLKQYQLIHEKQNELVLNYSVTEGFKKNKVLNQLQTSFTEFFTERNLNNSVKIIFNYQPKLIRSEDSQKLRQIYSNVKKPD